MWQTVYTIPNQVLGVPILKPEGGSFGFGLLLLVVLLCGGMGLWNKYRRQGTGGDFAGAATVLGIICAAIIFVLPKLTDDVGLPIRGYGVMLLIAVLSGVALGMWRAKQVGANPEIILSMMFLIFIGGLVGARGLFVIEYWRQFRPDTKLTVRTAKAEETLTLDSDTFVSVDGEKARIADLQSGQRVRITKRDPEAGPYARRVAVEADHVDESLRDSSRLGETQPGDADRPRMEATIVAIDRYSSGAIVQSLGKIADVTKGGIVVYGALLGAAVPFVWYVWKYRLPILPLCDVVVASLLLGQALGRIGCLCNGCCYGGVCENPNLWRVTFPLKTPPYLHQVETGKLPIAGLVLEKIPETDGVVIKEVEKGSQAAAHGLRPGLRITEMELTDVIPGQERFDIPRKKLVDPTMDEAYHFLYESKGQMLDLELQTEKGKAREAWTVEGAAPSRSLPVHPTQLYEAIYAGMMCLFAWLYFPFRRRDGEVFAVMLTMFPIFRFLNEWVRTDEPGTFFRSTIAAVSGYDFGLTISQVISLGLLLSAIPFWWWVLRKPAYSTLKPADWAPLNAHWVEAA